MIIPSPQLWLPERLRQRREDERLLRGRGGISRRWMPGYPCCCVPCSRSQFGLIDNENFGWQIHQQGKHGMRATFWYEDSIDCGGPNALPQGGEFECTVVFSEPMTVTYSVWGNVERDVNYDRFEAERDGMIKAGIHGMHLFTDDCSMEFQEDTAIEDVPAGKYTFKLYADTRDEFQHVDMVHNGEITWVPTNPLP